MLGSFTPTWIPPRQHAVLRRHHSQECRQSTTRAAVPELFDTGQESIRYRRHLRSNAFIFGLTFDKVTEQAAATAIRPLHDPFPRVWSWASSIHGAQLLHARPNQMPLPDRGMRDADETMIAFALETGGASFRGGTESSTINKVLGRVRADLSCFYLLSFYPERPSRGFAAASPRALQRGLSAVRRSWTGSWELRSRGQLARAERRPSARKAILLAAHTTPRRRTESETGRSVLIPWDSPTTSTRCWRSSPWTVRSCRQSFLPFDDLGSGYESRVRRTRSGTVWPSGSRSARQAIPVVLEASSGAFRRAPARSSRWATRHRFGQLAAVDLETDWPDPRRPGGIDHADCGGAAGERCVPAGRFPKGEEERPRIEGPLAIGDEPADTWAGRSTSSVLVCRGKREAGTCGSIASWWATSPVDFELQSWNGDDRRALRADS